MGWEEGGGGSGFVSGAAYKQQFMVYHREGGGGLGIFFWWWSQTLVQTGLLDFFVANYFSQRRPRVSQSVNVNSQLGTPKQFFVIFLGFSLVAKFN